MARCKPLNKDEVKAVAEELGRTRNPERDRTLFLLGCYTGGKVSQLLGLKISNVIEPDGTPVSSLAFQEATAQQRAAGTALGDDCRAVIREYLAFLHSIGKAEEDAYLFTTRRGFNPIGREHAYRIINEAAKRVGIAREIGTESMRKTFYLHTGQCPY